MKSTVHRTFVLTAALGLASWGLASCISCYNVILDVGDATKVGVAVGTILEAKKDLIGMLVEHIDDPSRKYVAVTELPGFSGRYVLKRIPIPVGTTFQVVGFERPRNFLCSGVDAVLHPVTPLVPSGAEAQISLVEATDGSFAVNRRMFNEQIKDLMPSLEK